jgi:ferredoxin, 2Fe-2S
MVETVTIKVTDRKGQQSEHTVPVGGPLMFALRDDARQAVEGACGGSATCGTCHVFIASSWYARLPPPQDFEAAMLDMLAEFDPDTSRLSCQIDVSAAIDGLEIKLAPEE